MNRSQYRLLVEALENKYSNRKPALTKNTVFMIGLGYAYLVLILLLSIAAIAATAILLIKYPNAGTIKLALILGVASFILLFSILKGVFIKLHPPVGRELTKDNAPRLFELLDEVRDPSTRIKFHKVLLTDDFNAAVVQHPRLGIFGWNRNYLILGFLLMESVSPEELKAIIAHEFGHLKGGDGRLGTWIYRVRATWERVINYMLDNGQGSIAVLPFIRWFWPRFNARAFVLSREQEYLADANAVHHTSAETTANALKRTDICAHSLGEEGWNVILEQAEHLQEPPDSVYSVLGQSLRNAITHPKSEQWLGFAANRPTDHYDTHPSLTDRLNAMGINDVRAPMNPISQYSSKYYLGEQYQNISSELSNEWRQAMSEPWSERRQYIADTRKRLVELETSLEEEDRVERANLITEIDGEQAGKVAFQELLSAYPRNVIVLFQNGLFLLNDNDPAGVKLMNTCLNLSPDGSEIIFAHLNEFYSKQGDTESLRELETREDSFDELYYKSQEERNSVAKNAPLMVTAINQQEIDSISEVAKKYPEIKSIHVARRDLKYLADHPSHVFAIKLKFPSLKLQSSDASEKILNQLIQEVFLDDGDWLFISDEGAHKNFCKRIRNEGILVYQKP